MRRPSLTARHRGLGWSTSLLILVIVAVSGLVAWVGPWSGLDLALAAPPSEGGESGGSERGPEASETPESTTPATPSPEQVREAAEVERLTTAAARIDALVAGQLDPSIDADALLTIDLRAPEAGRLRELLEAIRQGRAEREAAERAAAEIAEANQTRRRKLPIPRIEITEPVFEGPDADPSSHAEAELLAAQWRFWTLPEPTRTELLATHARKRDEIARQRGAETADKARLERMRQQAEQLEALIDGRLDPSIDPDSLVQVDLGQDEELTSAARLDRALGDPSPTPSDPAPDVPSSPDPGTSPDTEAPPTPAPTTELDDDLADAAAKLDAQRLRLASLSEVERAAVFERHAQRILEATQEAEVAELVEADDVVTAKVEEELTVAVDKAEQAKRERELAEAAAVQARSEALRRIAQERARLLGVKEAHAIYEIELATRKKRAIDAHEIALEWDRRVSELSQSLAGTTREQAADAMYADLRGALGDARDGLRATLDDIASSESGVAPVGDPLAGVPTDVDHSDLADLRAELEASEQSLRDQERDVVWAAADGGRDDIVMLNRARLTLLDLASDDLRDRMTGFAADGIAQTKREIDQIVLELRYRALALPRLGRGLLERLGTSPLLVLFGLLKFGFALLLFRYWRKRAGPTLERMRSGILTRDRGSPRFNAWVGMALWYVERIRSPLEWLALFGLMFELVLVEGILLELEVLWLVVLWLNLGYTVILFVDAVATHEGMVYGRGTTATARLRIRSLRMVGLTVVLTGLVLSLTEEIVGRGAIHKWVRSLIWVAAIPIMLVLIRWWRDYVFELIQTDKDVPDNALVRWIRANTEGWASFPAATIAAVYVFGRGLMRWTLRRATALETTRRLLAWMFRREVARQASARHVDATEVEPIRPEDYAEFEPARVVEDAGRLSAPMQAVAADLLAEVVALKTSQRGTISALIGERGAGKTTFLRRLAVELESRADEIGALPMGPGALGGAMTLMANATVEDGIRDEPESDKPKHSEHGRLTVRLLQCPPGGFHRLQRVIAESVGLTRNASRQQIVEALRQQSPLVFLIDDAHRLVRPAIGGLEGLDLFADFAREVSGDASWIASIGAAAWQYVGRARGDHVFFDQVISLKPWNEQQIGQLIRERCGAATIKPNFENIVIPRQFDVEALDEGQARPTEAERAELGYYRILWDYAKGNPAVALQFWRESLCVSAADESKAIKVRLFHEPSSAALDEVGATMHFVLRGVIQLEVASPSDLVACTQLPPADVADALRFALARGWVDRVGSYGDRYRVTWRWYRAITNMLRRQHLLAI